MKTLLCLSQFFKGQRLLESFKELGCKTVLLATGSVKNAPWDPAQVDEKFFIHDFDDERELLNSVTYLAQNQHFDLVVALEEYSMEAASAVRGHLGCPGKSEGFARRTRDKLTMRLCAQRAGIRVPYFSSFINRQTLASFLDQVPGPWMVKPRMAGGSCQIRKLHHAEEVWKLFEELGDLRSHHLIEAFVPGDVYHVDSIVHGGKVLMSVAGQYGSPPFDVWNGGGVFSSRTVPAKSGKCKSLLQMNEDIIKAMGATQGVNHVEFLGLGDEIYFLEIGARVPGSNLDRLTTAARGIDLFKESARLELEWLGSSGYKLPKMHKKEAGITLCLSREKTPNLGFCEPFEEVVWTLQKDHHAGCVIASSDSKRVDHILKVIKENLRRDHLAVLPPTDRPN